MRNLLSILNALFFRLRAIARAILSPVNLGVSALAEADGKIVLVRQSYTTGWHLPGGGVGRGEPPAEAVLRELREEIGLVSFSALELFGIYTRRVLWVSNVNLVYRLRDVVFDFKPNWEIREVRLVDPAAPGSGTTRGTWCRLMEFTGKQPQSRYW